jgi:hypothetical protein
MSWFDQFTTKKKSSNALMNLLRETFVVGMEEMSKKLSYLFWSPDVATKQQISQELNQREIDLKQSRSH